LALPDSEAPVSVDALVAAAIAPLQGTSIDTLYWQLGADPFHGTPTHRLSDWYTHRTRIGAVWGEQRATFQTAGEWRLARTVEYFNAQREDAIATVITHGHRAGLDVFVSLRVNDGSDCRLPDGLEDDHLSPTRAAHREWLLHGEGHVHPNVTSKQADHSRFAYNFALDAVRDYTLSLIQECIVQYDLDGFDLDFCRQPGLFKTSEAAAGALLITQMLHQVRTMLDHKAAQSGWPKRLSVRVPPDIAGNIAAGLDVQAWLRDGLLDVLIVADPRGWNYRLPIEAFRAMAEQAIGTVITGATNTTNAASGSGNDGSVVPSNAKVAAPRLCEIIAQNLCGFREEPPRSAKVLFGARGYYSVEQYRATAALHWQAGADGQFIWNQHLIRYIEDATYTHASWNDIARPDTLRYLDKHYLAGRRGILAVLPVTLDKALDAVSVIVELADDFADEPKPNAVLRVLIEQLTTLDELTFLINHVPLSEAAGTRRINYNDTWLDFDVSTHVAKGKNMLTIQLVQRNRAVAAPLALCAVEMLVSYPQ